MSDPQRARIIKFVNGHEAYSVFVRKDVDPENILSELHLNPLPKGVICISGGATAFPTEIKDQTVALIEDVVAPLACEYDLLVVDGGTEEGVMQIIGEAFKKHRVKAHIIGIHEGDTAVETRDWHEPLLMGFVPESQVTYPGDTRSPKPNMQLDPNHVYFVMVMDAYDWGEEVECMFSFIDYLADQRLPVINIIANGGRITLKEASHTVQRNRPVIILEGSKRATEVIVSALDGTPEGDWVSLLMKHEIAGKNSEQFQEALDWLIQIAKYDKIVRFDFLSRPLDEFKPIVLSALGISAS